MKLIDPTECQVVVEDEVGAWVCAEPAHDEPCPKCQVFDETFWLLVQNVFDGNIQMFVEEDGSFRFKMTDQGNAAAERLIATDPEARQMIDLLEIRDKVNRAMDDNEEL